MYVYIYIYIYIYIYTVIVIVEMWYSNYISKSHKILFIQFSTTDSGFHYKNGSYFNTKIHSYILAVDSNT